MLGYGRTVRVTRSTVERVILGFQARVGGEWVGASGRYGVCWFDVRVSHDVQRVGRVASW